LDNKSITKTTKIIFKCGILSLHFINGKSESTESLKNKMKKDNPELYYGKWVLLDRKDKVIFYSENLANVVKKGREYLKDDVTIEKKLPPGTCFF